MGKGRTVSAADLFCGAGGTSTGMGRACRDLGLQLNLLAVNHWPIAVETHSANHPAAHHLCETLDSVSPRIVVPERLGVSELDLLVASPECTHHSRARGGKPVNDQSRASGWHVPRWAEATNAKRIILENVPEWEEWGPTKNIRRGGKLEVVPDEKRKGETFRALMHAIESLGYKVEWKVLCAADFGDPTTRRRLFVMATKGKRVEWPEPSHGQVTRSLLRDVKPWRAAKEVIDWQLQGRSIFNRPKPLSPKTMERIIAGLRKFGGPVMEPFIVALRQHLNGRSSSAPLSTLANGGDHVEPFLLHLTHGGRVHDANKPFATITGAHRGEMAVVQPFLLSQASGGAPRGVDDPMPTICADGATSLVDAQFIVPNFGERPTQEPRTHSLDEPLPAITSHGAGCVVDAQAFVLSHASNGAARSVNEPLPTQVGAASLQLAEASFICSAGGPRVAARSVNEPLNTTLTRDHMAVVEPFITKYYGTGGAVSADEPLDTITVKDRFGLCTPLVFRTADGGLVALDIRFRMLQPKELAAGMSFDADYKFAGTKGDQIKQIGNAVPGELARALCRAQLETLYGVDASRARKVA
jgi:DNA (cytosine-5)-methyltransferase 1